MRLFPPPLSVILPPPSITIGPLLLKIFAVAVRTMVVGREPQSKVMTPPAATAATNAPEVQLAGVPVPPTVLGLAMLSACASAGTTQVPFGLPAGGPSSGLVGGPPSLLEQPASVARPIRAAKSTRHIHRW